MTNGGTWWQAQMARKGGTRTLVPRWEMLALLADHVSRAMLVTMISEGYSTHCSKAQKAQGKGYQQIIELLNANYPQRQHFSWEEAQRILRELAAHYRVIQNREDDTL